MLIESSHVIADEAAFWKASETAPPVPTGLTLLAMATRSDHTRVTCLWTAASRDQVQQYVDPVVGTAATSTFHELDPARSVGSPPTAATGPSLDSAGPYQLHEYGKRLLREGQKRHALAVFLLNARINPGVWVVDAGLARGHAALGDHLQAIVEMEAALRRAPEHRREYVRGLLERLRKGEDINR
jgi:hypothetical protein